MLAQVSNTTDQAWFTLTLARDVLTQARNALVEGRFVAYGAWSGWARRVERRCKWMWVAGLGSRDARCGAKMNLMLKERYHARGGIRTLTPTRERVF